MIILGIDFGTSNSCCSYFDGKKFNIIPNEYGNYTYPTSLFLDPKSKTILYANSAFDLNCNKQISLKNIISNVKKLITDNKEYLELNYNNNLRIFSINEIITFYLKYLKKISEDYTRINIKDIVITVPAYYSNLQRKTLELCCQKCDLNVLRIINEPTAAILAYSWNEMSNIKNVNIKNILVIDCGGGTTDYSIVNTDFQDYLFEVINVLGDNTLGGNNLTNILFNYILNKIYIKFKKYPQDYKKLQIKRLCENLKRELSFKENATIVIENAVNNFDFNITISRSIYYDLSKDIFRKIKNDIIKVTKNLSIKVDEIIFVGGTTRTPKFIDICKDIFGMYIKINNTINPDHIVSMGAAIQGYLLTNKNKCNIKNNNIILVDVTPMALGIKTYDDKMAIIISKNTPIPVTKSQIFTNNEDNINSLSIDIYQGNSQYVKNNIFLQSIHIPDIYKYKRGEMKIEIIFTINSNGILTVTTKNKTNNNNNNLTNIIENYNHNIDYDSDFSLSDIDISENS